jgi:hypothetical protein
VVPVPTVLEKGQIRVSDRALIERLDAYTAPRLVEYFDPDPCGLPRALSAPAAGAQLAMRRDMAEERARSLGVTIEARYTVGEYDILILSARESAGLETWLRDSGYRLPAGVSPVLGSYLKQGMKFFVARVNLKEQAKLGVTYLRPLPMAFESPKFMLPIRLGTVNADGPQELFVFALTRKGRVETTNYRTVRLPTGMEVPAYVKEEFPSFYRAMFAEQVRREDMRAVFLEYACDMSWCDPCAADPLSPRGAAQAGRLLAPGERRGLRSAAGARPGEHVRHAPARPLRRRALPRRPRLPGDGRSRQLPGALRAPPRIHRRGRLRGRPALSRVAPRPGRAGGRHAGLAHRLVHRGHPPSDRHRGRRCAPTGRTPVVAAAVW